jgi:predicted enzyme related to lactoylglutathione lyase
MIKGYTDFYYNVKNMKAALAFYEGALGLKRIYFHDHWATLQCGNLRLGLHWSEGVAVPLTPRDSHGQNAGGTLTLFSDNVREDREKILAGGGKILGESDQPWGHMLIFEDVDGNVLKLMNPKD